MFDVKEINKELLNFFSKYLNDFSTYIKEEDIKEVMKSGVDASLAFEYMLTSLMNASPELEDFIIKEYLSKGIYLEDIEEYANNPYYKNVKLEESNNKSISIKKVSYKAYEAFVRDDMVKTFDGRIIPQIGFFDKEFKYFAILKDDREWMSIKPNEINTMKKDIDDAKGNVLVFGLGMAYFTYMIALKDEVSHIDVVELDQDVIDIYNKEIKDKLIGIDLNKINIIKADAYEYASSMNNNYDYIYTDLWHDVSDGKEMYLKMLEIEKKNKGNAIWRYWIEKTIKLYL